MKFRPGGRSEIVDRSSSRVYGCCGSREHLAGVADLDDPAGVHHRDPVARLGDDAEVVGDQQQRGVEVAAQVVQDPDDLRLDQHVERGRRLVGDDERRAQHQRRARSSAAAACRRRTRAGRRGSGSAGCPSAAAPRASGAATSSLEIDSARAACSVSSKCSEIRISGFSRVSGSWKIMPEVDAAHARAAPWRSSVQHVVALEQHLAVARRRRRAAGPSSPRPSVDLPQPDSPTRPRISPGCSVEGDAVDRPDRARGRCRTRPAGRGPRSPGPGPPGAARVLGPARSASSAPPPRSASRGARNIDRQQPAACAASG